MSLEFIKGSQLPIRNTAANDDYIFVISGGVTYRMLRSVFLAGISGGSPGALPDVVLTVGDLTDLGGNEFQFGTGYSWRLGGNQYENSSPITVVINPATEGFYRIDVAYVTNEGEILIQEGEESEDVAVEPSIPTGTLKLRTFNVFGDVVSIGGGIPLPFDMTLLDELTELDPDADIWMNINGLDVRAKVNLLLDFMLAIATDVVNSLDFLTIKILASAPATPTANTIRFYSIANTVAAIFPDGLQISFVKNTTQNGTVTMPFHSGRMELVRPVSTLTGTTTYNFQETDTSRSVRVASGNMDFVIPSLVSGNHKYVVINQSNGVVRLTTGGVYRINGAFNPITLPQGEFTITRVATFDFVVNLPGGAPAWGGITGTLANQLDLMAALNKTWCVFASATVPITTNNATSETIVSELTIPANTWRNQTTLRLQTLNILGATAAGTKQFQFRVATASGVLGTLLARFNTTATSSVGIPFARSCSIYDNKINSNVAATTSLLDNEGGNQSGGNPEIAIDMTAPIYIQFTISMPNNSDTLTTQDVKCLGLY